MFSYLSLLLHRVDTKIVLITPIVVDSSFPINHLVKRNLKSKKLVARHLSVTIDPPNDPYFASQWYLHSESLWDTHIDSVWRFIIRQKYASLDVFSNSQLQTNNLLLSEKMNGSASHKYLTTGKHNFQFLGLHPHDKRLTEAGLSLSRIVSFLPYMSEPNKRFKFSLIDKKKSTSSNELFSKRRVPQLTRRLHHNPSLISQKTKQIMFQTPHTIHVSMISVYQWIKKHSTISGKMNYFLKRKTRNLNKNIQFLKHSLFMNNNVSFYLNKSTNVSSKHQHLIREDSSPKFVDSPIVAIIDAGCDLAHPDIKQSIWRNYNEIDCFNGIDDDNNGFIDDCYGWDFVEDQPVRDLHSYIKPIENLHNSTISNSYLNSQSYYNLSEINITNPNIYNDTHVYTLTLNDKIKKYFNYLSYNSIIQWVLPSSNKQTFSYLDHGTHAASLIGSSTGNSQGIAGACLGQCRIMCLRAINNLASSTLFEEISMKKNHSGTSTTRYTYTKQFLMTENKPNNTLSFHVKTNTSYLNPTIYWNQNIASSEINSSKWFHSSALHSEVKLRDTESLIIKALHYAHSMGAKIASNSYGRRGKPFSRLQDEITKISIHENHIPGRGLLFITAAGNEGLDLDIAAQCKTKHATTQKSIVSNNNNFFPAALSCNTNTTTSGILIVGASDRDGKKVDFSNFGNNAVDLFAPGVLIVAGKAGGGFDFLTGTSLSSPIVAGAAALFWALFPTLCANEIRETMIASVQKSSHLNGLCVSGGTLNIWKAVQQAALKNNVIIN